MEIFRDMSQFKVLCLLLSFFVVNANASEREKNEQEILKYLDIAQIANSAIKQYRNEAVRIYPNISDTNVDENFSEVFSSGRKLIFNAYKNSLSEFTDEELVDLIELYKSDFGKWYITNFQNFNNKAMENMNNATKKLNDAYIQRVQELQSP